ncbi:MAG: hypothetical protein ACP5OG_02180 [Candidatus Nanoarchaeia archaeon]
MSQYDIFNKIKGIIVEINPSVSKNEITEGKKLYYLGINDSNISVLFRRLDQEMDLEVDWEQGIRPNFTIKTIVEIVFAAQL